MSLTFWVYLALVVMMTGCSSSEGAGNASNGAEEGRRAEVSLQHPEYPGSMVLYADTASNVSEGSFAVPVFLQDVEPADGLDTVTLELELPSGVQLSSLRTAESHAAEIDGQESQNPTVYVHSDAISSESYSPLYGRPDPLFSLILEGDKPPFFSMRGSFFFTDRRSLRTQWATLAVLP